MRSDSAPSPILPFAAVARRVSGGGRRVLDLLLKSGGMSQAQLTRALDLSQPTVTRLIQGFQQDGMVLVSARQADRPGNPSVHVALHPDFAYSLGVAMLGDVLSMTLMDFAGQIRGQRLGAMPSMTRPAVIDRLRQFMAELIAESGIEPRRLIGAGVGFAGFYVEGRVFNPPTYLDDWALVDIEPILADALKMPVIADNSSTVAAIGESLFGVGRRHDSFAYLHLSNGFGGGIITDGEPRRGVNRNAGEFGGIWTQFGATYANLDLLQTCLRARGHDFATVAEMARSVDLGWAGVDDWLDLAVPSFTLLCNVLTYTIDPGLIVIGGQLPRRIAQELAKRITVRVATDRRGHPPPVPQVVAAEASGEPVCLGAAVMPLRTAFFA